jgi:hypothetical protein
MVTVRLRRESGVPERRCVEALRGGECGVAAVAGEELGVRDSTAGGHARVISIFLLCIEPDCKMKNPSPVSPCLYNTSPADRVTVFITRSNPSSKALPCGSACSEAR